MQGYVPAIPHSHCTFGTNSFRTVSSPSTSCAHPTHVHKFPHTPTSMAHSTTTAPLSPLQASKCWPIYAQKTAHLGLRMQSRATTLAQRCAITAATTFGSPPPIAREYARLSAGFRTTVKCHQPHQPQSSLQQPRISPLLSSPSPTQPYCHPSTQKRTHISYISPLYSINHQPSPPLR